MDLRLLLEFLVLSESLNFTRAARRLNMTQPVLSRHIKFLELHFGAQLLTRNTHRVDLTDVGRVFAGECAKINAQYEQSLAMIRTCPGVSRHSLSIGILGEATRSFLSAFLIGYNDRHPQVAIDCVDGDVDTIMPRVERGESDLGFVIRPRGAVTPPHLANFTIASDPLCLVINRNHALAVKERVSISDVAQWPMIGLNRQISPMSFEFNSHFFSRHGYEYKTWKECANLETVCFNVEFNDRAVILLPLHRRYLVGANARLIMFAESDCMFEVEMLWNPENSNPSLKGFLTEFKEFSRTWDWSSDVCLGNNEGAQVILEGVAVV
ncbi:LysR substrate-binding domain-containing protein [Rhodopseudomonas palustris]|uniref:Transcriptional regulator, LysR family n=1 Tax=Rhodopseudomonas palustris (strain BisB18) TaxID=316056 RepID=Q21BN0_RHOPB